MWGGGGIGGERIQGQNRPENNNIHAGLDEAVYKYTGTTVFTLYNKGAKSKSEGWHECFYCKGSEGNIDPSYELMIRTSTIIMNPHGWGKMWVLDWLSDVYLLDFLTFPCYYLPVHAQVICSEYL